MDIFIVDGFRPEEANKVIKDKRIVDIKPVPLHGTIWLVIMCENQHKED